MEEAHKSDGRSVEKIRQSNSWELSSACDRICCLLQCFGHFRISTFTFGSLSDGVSARCTSQTRAKHTMQMQMQVHRRSLNSARAIKRPTESVSLLCVVKRLRLCGSRDRIAIRTRKMLEANLCEIISIRMVWADVGPQTNAMPYRQMCNAQRHTECMCVSVCHDQIFWFPFVLIFRLHFCLFG